MAIVSNVIVVGDYAAVNGGQAKVSIDSALLLKGSGFEVTFFAACGPVDSRLTSAGVKVVCLDQNDILKESNRIAAATRGIWNFEAASKLARLCKKFDPRDTVLHCHGYAKALSPAIGPVLTRGPLASVYTMHEYFLACPNGGFYDYRRNAICEKTALGRGCLVTNCDVRHATHKAWRVARQAVTWSVGRMPRAFRDIIYISKTQRRVLEPYLNRATRLHYVPNPIPATDTPPVRAEENDVFLFVGRLNPEKGGLLFAQAAKRAGIAAVFVGDGPERAAIEAANPDALITGWLSPEGVQHWLARARCLVFPSLWYETQGMVTQEALAKGVPVIAGKWTAAAEALEDGLDGLLYNKPNLDDLTTALIELRDDGHRVFQHVLNAANLDAPSTEVHLAALDKVYSQILSQRTPS